VFELQSLLIVGAVITFFPCLLLRLCYKGQKLVTFIEVGVSLQTLDHFERSGPSCPTENEGTDGDREYSVAGYRN
jgi:hypothetical protein